MGPVDTSRAHRFLPGVAFVILLLVAPSFAQTTAINVTYQWTPPTTGSAVHHYVVEYSANAGSTWAQVAAPTTNSVSLSLTVGGTYIVRVAGVDAQSRQGPYSAHSDPYTPDPGAPSAPGKPARIP